MILHVHSQSLDGRIVGRTLGHGPRQHHPVPFQAQIVMKRAGPVFLHHERELPGAAVTGLGGHLLALGLTRDIEAALLSVLVEGDPWLVHSIVTTPGRRTPSARPCCRSVAPDRLPAIRPRAGWSREAQPLRRHPRRSSPAYFRQGCCTSQRWADGARGGAHPPWPAPPGPLRRK